MHHAAPALPWPSVLARLRDEYAAALKDGPQCQIGDQTFRGLTGFDWVSFATIGNLRAHGAELRHIGDSRAFERRLFVSYRVIRNGRTVAL